METLSPDIIEDFEILLELVAEKNGGELNKRGLLFMDIIEFEKNRNLYGDNFVVLDGYEAWLDEQLAAVDTSIEQSRKEGVFFPVDGQRFTGVVNCGLQYVGYKEYPTVTLTTGEDSDVEVNVNVNVPLQFVGFV